ncbi:MAG: adenosylcobinamide-GDP ribazoletransferase [Verrucomicrobia bacterium]|nr:adenosylcobinamide-GDP ribazoletransferase [Verrucomicrobiota bacterium]MCG2681871.1 adenosylcobinamide-GDP ribazoletransferase [Kiritimatiellia bacterium]MBU4247971.1 adenosylcobinamide-GDP ribazoletransferase [Verrucomicrobiota bacterium]MBU4291788.1 adenosylcobinamide-GDP ribazoletransferase [Verrucomicrobiota bacterium]MBU4430107.1 adenosylcobinamide-GDP ribazoletransferase [Verrucomicrobiota bacterium]
MLFGGFITSFKTLTVLPLPGKGSERIADSLYYFPLIGAFIGGLITLAAWLIGYLLDWPTGAGIACVVLISWVTGALHLDGLGDVADAYSPGRTRERMLEIMKDPHMGAFGVTAIVLALLVKTIALVHLTLLAQWAWIPVPFILSRMTMVLLAVTLPYARPEGGTAEVFVKNAHSRHFIVASIVGLGLCALLTGIAGGFVFIFAFIMGYGLARWMKRSFGGVTGDLLGMSNEMIESVLLFSLAALIPYLDLIHGFTF